MFRKVGRKVTPYTFQHTSSPVKNSPKVKIVTSRCKSTNFINRTLNIKRLNFPYLLYIIENTIDLRNINTRSETNFLSVS